jgi:hypothetical protein
MAHIDWENILFTFGMFAILVIAFGQTIPSVDVQNNLNIIFAGWPQPVVPVKGCAWTDVSCNFNSLAGATAAIANAIFYPATLIVNLLFRISAFGSLMTTVTFGSTGSLSVIPFFNLFLLALFIVIAVGLFKLFRGPGGGL